MWKPLECVECGEIMSVEEDHRCVDKKGNTKVTTRYAVAGRVRSAAAGICPGCRGTGKERIHHLVADPKHGVGAKTDYVEENECPECGGKK